MFFDIFRTNRLMYWSLYPKKFPPESKNNFGGRVILPDTILYDLVQMQMPTPYIFEISNEQYSTYCGVLEFTGNEKEIIVPEWLYNQLNMGDKEITLNHRLLPQGKKTKLLPHTTDFLEIESVKCELELQLRNYQVLSRGDEIQCELENIVIPFTVVETDPADTGICITDVDLAVEFLPPIGYEEKIENEKSVCKYVEIYDLEDGYKGIIMKCNGLYFPKGE